MTSTKKLLPRMTRRNNMRSKPRRKNNAPNISLIVLIQKLVSRSAYFRQYIFKPPIITVCLPRLWLVFEHILYLTRSCFVYSFETFVSSTPLNDLHCSSFFCPIGISCDFSPDTSNFRRRILILSMCVESPLGPHWFFNEWLLG